MSTEPVPADQARYGRVASILHWLIGLALIGQITFGFLLDELAPRGTPSRGDTINLHKSFGIVLALLIVLRLLWRLRCRQPAWPVGMPLWQQRAALLGHRALYACMLVMPASGYTASNFSKYGVKFFGHAIRPWGPELPQVYAVFNWIHVSTAWLFTALIAGHVTMAVLHALRDKDGWFQRISPWRLSR
ncbi:MAG: cytochrome b [Rubrivivax sp.]